MLKRLLLAGVSAYYYGQNAANPARRPNMLASLALQEAEGSRTVNQIRTVKAAEIPDWLDKQMQRHVNDEIRHARILTRTVEWEGFHIDLDSEGAQVAINSVGEGAIKRYQQADNMEDIPLTALLANILLAEEMGVRSFRSILNALPESLTKTHAAIESILQDELRHVQYLSDALQTLQASFLIEQYRQDIENKVFQDFGKVFEFLSKPSEERPVLVKAGVQPELTLI
jgi:hypothetical protein